MVAGTRKAPELGSSGAFPFAFPAPLGRGRSRPQLGALGGFAGFGKGELLGPKAFAIGQTGSAAGEGLRRAEAGLAAFDAIAAILAHAGTGSRASAIASTTPPPARRKRRTLSALSEQTAAVSARHALIVRRRSGSAMLASSSTRAARSADCATK